MFQVNKNKAKLILNWNFVKFLKWICGCNLEWHLQWILYHHEEMTIFGVFLNKSQCFMAIFSSFKSHSFMYYDCILWFFISNHSIYVRIKTIRYFGLRSGALANKNRSNSKIEKRKLTITLKVLDEAKVQFSQTKEFIEKCLEQECLK